MQPSQFLAIAVFVFTYALIVLKPKGLNEARAAMIGAALSDSSVTACVIRLSWRSRPKAKTSPNSVPTISATTSTPAIM